jgi:hypothetical protein
MRRIYGVLAAGVLVAGCADSPTPATAPEETLLVPIAASAERGGRPENNDLRLNSQAGLTGLEEVPVRLTPAHGNSVVLMTPNDEGVRYVLVANDISNVVAAHIHQGPLGVNGPIVAFLYGNAPPGGGLHNGLLAKGVITAADLIGPLTGQPLSALIDLIKSGNAYVNVHTNDGVAPTNTGPGDFPGGEIRGQLEAHGH